jgi:hypothetical protein
MNYAGPKYKPDDTLIIKILVLHVCPDQSFTGSPGIAGISKLAFVESGGIAMEFVFIIIMKQNNYSGIPSGYLASNLKV